jgi:hypothetical protein
MGVVNGSFMAALTDGEVKWTFVVGEGGVGAGRQWQFTALYRFQLA